MLKIVCLVLKNVYFIDVLCYLEGMLILKGLKGYNIGSKNIFNFLGMEVSKYFG